MSEITIVHEDDDIVAITKPVGWIVHEDGVDRSDTPVVVDWFLERCPEATGVGEAGATKDGTPLNRSGVVHRLDIDTSGILLLMKHQEAYEYFKHQFHDRLIKKEYRAFVYGYMNERWGTIDRPIGRSAKDYRLRSAQRGATGTLRDATTHWELIGKGEYELEPFSYIKLMPVTGRTHQLRVHLKAIDRPIVGDPLYAGARAETSNNLGLNRLALHAHQLNCIMLDGEEKRLISSVPQEFIEAADAIAE